MRNLAWVFVVVGMLASMAGGASAHSSVSKSFPANGAEISELPKSIGLEFGYAIRITQVTMEHNDSGEQVELDTSAYKKYANEFSFALPAQAPGLYRIRWRALAQDGHAMQGAFAFTVK